MFFIDDLMEFLVIPLIILIMVVAVVVTFVYLPVAFYAKEQCLDAGYPKATVTWNFRRFCMNLEGTITVDVSELK